ncbi:MAG: hypothetical protein R2911_18280 [Caldilineaceae bacterium]
MMRFRPCIDLREGRVVQIVGGTLRDGDAQDIVTNFETDRSPAAFAEMYQRDHLPGGHVIALGPGNREAALCPGGLSGRHADGRRHYARQRRRISGCRRQPRDCDFVCVSAGAD